MAAARSDVEVDEENTEEAMITMEVSNKVAMVEVSNKVTMAGEDNKAIKEATVEEETCHRAGSKLYLATA